MIRSGLVRAAALAAALLLPLLLGGCLRYRSCEVVIDFEPRSERALFTFRHLTSSDGKAEDADDLLAFYYLGRREDDMRTALLIEGESLHGQALLTEKRFREKGLRRPSSLPLPEFRIEREGGAVLLRFPRPVEILETEGEILPGGEDAQGEELGPTVRWPAGTKRIRLVLKGKSKEKDHPLLPLLRRRLAALAAEGDEPLSVDPTGTPGLEAEMPLLSPEEAEATLKELEE